MRRARYPVRPNLLLLLGAALACRDEAPDPTGPAAGPTGTTAAAVAPLSFRHGEHKCAIGTDNKAYCWGGNSRGQLGNGTTDPSTTPVAVAPPE